MTRLLRSIDESCVLLAGFGVLQWLTLDNASNLPASVLMNNSELQVQARQILDSIALMPFEQCQPLQIVSHWGNAALLLELEAIILRATEPPYNVQIPAEI